MHRKASSFNDIASSKNLPDSQLNESANQSPNNNNNKVKLTHSNSLPSGERSLPDCTSKVSIRKKTQSATLPLTASSSTTSAAATRSSRFGSFFTRNFWLSNSNSSRTLPNRSSSGEFALQTRRIRCESLNNDQRRNSRKSKTLSGIQFSQSIGNQLVDQSVRDYRKISGNFSDQSGRRSGPLKCLSSTSNQDGIEINMPTNSLKSQQSFSSTSSSSSSCGSSSTTSKATMNCGSIETSHKDTKVKAGLVNYQCLLPNGIIFDIEVHPDDPIYSIKQVVFKTATENEELPLRGTLTPNSYNYSLLFLNSSSGILEECCDEKKTLREIKPFHNILKFKKRTKDKGHSQFKMNIGNLIGKNLEDFEKLRNCEINDFRWRMKVFTNEIAQERKAKLEKSMMAKIRYQYPARVISNLHDNLDVDSIEVNLIWNEHVKNKVKANLTPIQLINQIGEELNYTKDYIENCFIKTLGEDSFLLGNHRLIDFQFIRERYNAGKIPKLMILNSDSIQLDDLDAFVYSYLNKDVCALNRDSVTNSSLTAMCLNSINNSMYNSLGYEKEFCITVSSFQYLFEVSSYNTLYRSMGMQMGLFHGASLLCPIQTVLFPKCFAQEDGLFEINQMIKFDLLISNMPRMTKLCIGVFEEKRKGQKNPLFFVNFNVFDYRGKIKWKSTLHLWNYSPGDNLPTHQNLSPLKQCICNPNVSEAPALVISFGDCDNNILSSIEYPDLSNDELLNHLINGNGALDKVESNPEILGLRNVGTINKFYQQELKQIADCDPLHDLTFQEKDLIWRIREYCLTQLPKLLPRIIDCVDYSNPVQVIQLAHLLKRWPLLNPEEALQLLDYCYPDENVRRFAIKSLRKATDDEIIRYLLQLAQALKHEQYFQCDLVEFLLERALKNQHIGHYLFWELRAEMNSPSVGLRFGLILEAYLTAAPEHVKILDHQYALLQKCRATQDSLSEKELGSCSYDRAKIEFKSSIETQFKGNHPYVNFVTPLNPGIRCQKIKISKCKLMNSKMRPQMLGFENIDSNIKLTEFNLKNDIEDVVIMYKKGDDLRQDRLTLQLLKVMDLLWKKSGLDFRLSLYTCMSTDTREGFIQVVQSAETICSIQMAQRDFLTSIVEKGALLNWLRNCNPTEHLLRQAQYEFTQSCAGYSVACYILGIGDRHNDNIMLKTNGQMFHIDFGHFLGNFKHKFGFCRERVSMILSSEFMEIIKADLGEKNNFEYFRTLCEKAFLTIRNNSSLIISLLAMMISTGLPELNSEQDLNVIRSNLRLDQNESDALEAFRKDFEDSLKNAWTISLDWCFHMMKQIRET